MKLLLKIAFKEKKHILLIVLMLLGMVFHTFSSQLEIFTIGMVARKSPSVIEVFGHDQSKIVKKSDIEKRWRILDEEGKGEVSETQLKAFIAKKKKQDVTFQVMNAVDRYFSLSGNAKMMALMIILVALFKGFSLFLHRYANCLFSIKVSRDLRQSYFEHLQKLSMGFYQKHNIGSLSTRVVADADVIAQAINACLTNYIQTPFVISTSLLICFLTSWQLSLIVFICFPLIAYPIYFLAVKIKKLAKQMQQNQEKFAQVLIDFLSGVQTIKVFAMEAFSLQKYTEQNNQMEKLQKKNAKYDSAARPIIHTIGMLILATTLLCGLYLFQMEVAEVLFFCGMLYLLYEPVKKFTDQNHRIQRGAAAAERMYEVIATKPQIMDRKDAIKLKEVNSITFKDVWFRYQQEWVLRGVSFEIKKGEMVALVGPTGSGKSTIAQLLPRLYDVEKGEILINGIPIQQYSRRSLRESIAFIPQKPFLFMDSIAKNIAFGREFSFDQIKKAAQKAHAQEFIEALPQKYETILAESGKSLSGGQQQRLAIARAIIKDAPILVMDEATSSLDALSELKIKDTMEKLHGKVIQLIIAHRLTTIENADRIIYLEEGKKVAEGDKNTLLKTCPQFKENWETLHGKEKALAS